MNTLIITAVIILGAIAVSSVIIILKLTNRPGLSEKKEESPTSTPTTTPADQSIASSFGWGWLIAVLVILAGGWIFWSLTPGIFQGDSRPKLSEEEQALLNNGWSITDVKNFSNTIVGIRFPAGTTGKELEFKNFVWIRAYARHSDGSFKKIFDDGNEHFTVIVGENNFVFLEVPKNKKIPDMVYWKTRG